MRISNTSRRARVGRKASGSSPAVSKLVGNWFSRPSVHSTAGIIGVLGLRRECNGRWGIGAEQTTGVCRERENPLLRRHPLIGSISGEFPLEVTVGLHTAMLGMDY